MGVELVTEGGHSCPPVVAAAVAAAAFGERASRSRSFFLISIFSEGTKGRGQECPLSFKFPISLLPGGASFRRGPSFRHSRANGNPSVCLSVRHPLCHVKMDSRFRGNDRRNGNDRRSGNDRRNRNDRRNAGNFLCHVGGASFCHSCARVFRVTCRGNGRASGCLP